MFLSSVLVVVAAGPYAGVAVLALVLGAWIGDYPSRRVLLDEQWTLATCLRWQGRFSVAWLGLPFMLLLAPSVIQAAGPLRWPVAAALALVLGLWAHQYTPTFLWLVRAAPMPWPSGWQALSESSHARRPHLLRMPVPGGRFVSAFAFPSTRAPSVLFTDPALELLSAREQTAVFAHELRARARRVAPGPGAATARDPARRRDRAGAEPARGAVGRPDHARRCVRDPRSRARVGERRPLSRAEGSQVPAPEDRLRVVGRLCRPRRVANPRLMAGWRRPGRPGPHRTVTRRDHRRRRRGDAAATARCRRAPTGARRSAARASGARPPLHGAGALDRLGRRRVDARGHHRTHRHDSPESRRAGSGRRRRRCLRCDPRGRSRHAGRSRRARRRLAERRLCRRRRARGRGRRLARRAAAHVRLAPGRLPARRRRPCRDRRADLGAAGRVPRADERTPDGHRADARRRAAAMDVPRRARRRAAAGASPWPALERRGSARRLRARWRGGDTGGPPRDLAADRRRSARGRHRPAAAHGPDRAAVARRRAARVAARESCRRVDPGGARDAGPLPRARPLGRAIPGRGSGPSVHRREQCARTRRVDVP